MNNQEKVGLTIKDLRKDNSPRIKDKTIKIVDYKNNYFDGKVCLLKMYIVSEPVYVDSPIGKVKIMDNNYKHLMIAPRNANWWLTVMFTDKEELIESYFDITRLNDFTNEDNPYFLDLKLDVCIPKDHEPSLMDEDELQEAYENGIVTKEEIDMAYDIANKIIDFYNTNKEQYYEFINRMVKELER